MSANTKIKPTMFLAYDYDKEEAYINRMADNGWQLKKGGLFHHTYFRSDKCYRYKLDYNNKVHFNMDDYDRYLSIFAEQGWEHVNSTFNGWHYFRKKYDPAIPEEDYELYTDDSSLKQMLGRWNRFARILQIMYLLLLPIYVGLYVQSKSTAILGDCILFVFGALLMEVGIINMKKKRVSSKPRLSLGIYGGYFLFAVLLFTCFLTIYLIYHPYHPLVDKIDYSTRISLDTPDYTGTLIVKKDGKYYLDIKCISKCGKVNVRLSGDNKVIFNGTGSRISAAQGPVRLHAGVYTLAVSYQSKDNGDAEAASLDESKESVSAEDLSETNNVKILAVIKK